LPHTLHDLTLLARWERIAEKSGLHASLGHLLRDASGHLLYPAQASCIFNEWRKNARNCRL